MGRGRAVQSRLPTRVFGTLLLLHLIIDMMELVVPTDRSIGFGFSNQAGLVPLEG